MKINCGPTALDQYNASLLWHPWCAWRPVRIGSGDCRWLETIERRYVKIQYKNNYLPFGGPYGRWEYRA